MERKPSNTVAVESSSEGTDSADTEKSTSKKKTLRHVPLEVTVAEKPPVPSPEKPKKELFDFGEKSSEDAEVAEVAELSHEEEQHVNQQIAAEHLTELAPNVEDDPREPFLRSVEEGADVEVAFTEAATELGVPEAEIAEMLEENIEADAAEIEDEPASDQEAGSDEPIEYEVSTADADEGEIDLSPAVAGGAGGSGGGTGGSGGGRTGSGGAGGGGAGSGGSSGRPGAAAPVPIPAPASVPNFNTAPTQNQPMESFESRRNRAGQLLLVGVVGYLIGRRRGRIKTEKQLIPVQKKLEKQVINLEQNLRHKENQLVAVKARLQERSPKPVVETIAKAPTEQRMQPSRAESRLNLEKPVRAERLGQMIIAAEAPKIVEKRIMERPNSIRQAFRAEEVKDMKRGELLELSEKIVIEGASLRRIYESRLIGEKQLRHLVSEFLQGKDIHKALNHEMVEHEIDFERDPILRDRVRDHLSGNASGSGLGDLLASVGIVEEKNDSQLERRLQKEADKQAKLDRKEKQQRLVTDVAMVTAVVVLAVAVLILALRG